MLSALCRYLWRLDEGGDYENLNEPLHALGTAVIRALWVPVVADELTDLPATP